MPEHRDRQLLSVLFADIQGYTRMMQRDEESGRLILRNFKEHIVHKVAQFQGEVINFYGDGVLCTFKSPTQAATCAISLQEIFRATNPVTPVRIGLHQGKVAFEDGNAYGDTINITSRIESFGVPNSVLISKVFRQAINGQSKYSTTALGSFQFKNVEKPMQIFAINGHGLIVPKKQNLKGKGKVLASSFTKIKKWGAGVAIVSLLLLFRFFSPFGNIDSFASKDLMDARIAVLPFENKTGITDLDIVGDMASDWIIQGLMYLDDIQLVGFESIQENIQYASMEDSSKNFARRTGAEKIVKGRYYIDKEELVFQSQIWDVNTGKIDLTLPTIRGPKGDNAALVSELQAKFVTAFDAQNHNFSPGIAKNPPPHKAYQLFREGIDIYSEDAEESRHLFTQALEMDSSFFWPYIWATASFFNEGKGNEADSTFALIKQNIDFKSLNSFDRQWYVHWQALLEKDLEKAFKASLKILERDPKQSFSNVEAGIMANNLNMPQKAVEIFEYLDPEFAPLDIELDTWWHNYYAHNLYRVGRYQDAEKITQLILPKFRRHWNYYDRLAEIYVQQNKTTELSALLKEMQTNQMTNSDILNEYVFITQLFGVRNQKEQQLFWARAGIEWANQQGFNLDPYALGNLYYVTQQYSIAKPLFQEAIDKNGPTWLNLSRLGNTCQQLGHIKSVQKILQQLTDLYQSTDDVGYLVAQAHIYSLTDDKNKAVTFFNRAIKKGFAYSPTTFGNDLMLLSLKGYPPFEALIKTRDNPTSKE